MAEFVPLEKRMSKADRELLAEWFESRIYKVFRKWLLEDGRDQLAIRALLGSVDNLRFTQGQAEALKQIHLQLKAIHKTTDKYQAKAHKLVEKKLDKRPS